MPRPATPAGNRGPESGEVSLKTGVPACKGGPTTSAATSSRSVGHMTSPWAWARRHGQDLSGRGLRGGRAGARSVQRIILTRPAVEAGERLGFLPGDLTQKVDPYLRPLYDALYDLMGFGAWARPSAGVIEIAPLAFMRGAQLEQRLRHPG